MTRRLLRLLALAAAALGAYRLVRVRREELEPAPFSEPYGDA